MLSPALAPPTYADFPDVAIIIVPQSSLPQADDLEHVLKEEM